MLHSHRSRFLAATFASALAVATVAVARPASAAPTCAAGEVEITVGGQTVCEVEFTAAGTFTVPAGVKTLDAVVVGGGGGGASNKSGMADTPGGGGGGGAVVVCTQLGVTPNSSLAVTVGAGGPGGTASTEAAGAGEPSSLGTVCTAGGGAGGTAGNGGDSGTNVNATPQSFTGGKKLSGYSAGGGAGAAANGSDGSPVQWMAEGGAGGSGATVTSGLFTGDSRAFGGGGGGGGEKGAGAAGGTGGGAHGGKKFNGFLPPASASANTGGGGGGAYYSAFDSPDSTGEPGGAGGSGIVIVRYVPVEITAPEAPTSLTATAGDGQVGLSWTAPADGGSPITGYLIEQSADGVTWTVAVADTGSSATTRTVTGLTNGTRYSFRVAAINATGTGEFSDPAEATPVAPDNGGGGTPVGPVVPGSNPYLPAEGLPLGGSLLLVDGQPAPLTVSPDAATDPSGLNITGPGFTMRLVGQTAGNKPLGLTPDGALLLEQDRTAFTEGTGFKALSEVELYVFSTTRFLGTVTTDADGAFRGSVPLPLDIPAGRHTLQANGLAPDGAVRSLSLGVQVQEQPVGKKAQRPTARAGLPARIAAEGRTVLAPRNPRTNAGQLIKTRVRCTPRGAQAAGETRLCSVIRGPQGKVTLRTFGSPVKVVVVQKARANATHTAYLKRTVYLNGRKR